MGKILVEKSGQGMLVTNKLSPREEVNDYEYGTVAGNAPSGLFSVSYESNKKDRTFSCDVTGMIPLSSYFSGIVTQKMFTNTVRQLISIVKGCENNRLDVRNLYLSADHIYIEPRTKEVTCILWPLSNNQDASNPAEFFRELPYNLVFNKQEECAYVSDYIQFFHTLAGPFSIDGFEQFFNGTPPSQKPGNEPQGNAPGQSYDPLKRMVEQKAGGGQRGMDATEKTGTAVLGNFPGSTEMETEESPYPYLIRESTNQIISVDQSGFRIGKDKNNVDFCVLDNTAISRIHAIINIRDDRYFIVDQGSTNKTYIDGRAIQPNQETEIFPGAKIRLANEEFVFYI